MSQKKSIQSLDGLGCLGLLTVGLGLFVFNLLLIVAISALFAVPMMFIFAFLHSIWPVIPAFGYWMSFAFVIVIRFLVTMIRSATGGRSSVSKS